VNYWSDDGDPPGRDAMRHIHALVEGIRERVTAGAHLVPDPLSNEGVRDKVMNGFGRLLTGYAHWGGHHHHGWWSYKNEQNFLGKVSIEKPVAALAGGLGRELAGEAGGGVDGAVPGSRSSVRGSCDGVATRYAACS